MVKPVNGPGINVFQSKDRAKTNNQTLGTPGYIRARELGAAIIKEMTGMDVKNKIYDETPYLEYGNPSQLGRIISGNGNCFSELIDCSGTAGVLRTTRYDANKKVIDGGLEIKFYKGSADYSGFTDYQP